MTKSSRLNIQHGTDYLSFHSGSAFPATLAFQIRELERETSKDLVLDAIVTVIDAENFAGYEGETNFANVDGTLAHSTQTRARRQRCKPNTPTSF